MPLHIELLADHTEFIPRIAWLYEQEWGSYRPGETLEQKGERIRSICGRGTVPTAVVAMDGTELRGSAFLIRSDLVSRPDLTPWLGGVYVLAEYRRRGIGSVLTEHVESLAKLNGVSKLYLFTDKTESLYARLGWAPFERTTHKGKAIVIMAKSLAD